MSELKAEVFQLEIKTLKNGLRIVHIPFPNLHSVTLKLMGRAGSSWENSNELGMAHFLEHVVFEGTKKYPTYERLQSLLNDVGGQHNAYTSEDKVAFLAKVLNEDYEKSLDYLSQITLFPSIKRKDVKKHKEIISQELKMYEDKPVSKFFLDARRFLFPNGSRFQIPVIGTIESINSANSETIEHFKNRHYHSGNFVLGIGSSLDQEYIFEAAEKYFGSMPEGKLHDYTDVEIPINTIVFTQNNEKIQQSTIYIGFESYKIYDKRRFAENILSDILGGTDLSRLFIKIKQKLGLAYYVNCDTTHTPSYGSINITMQLDKKRIGKAINIVKEELENISQNLVSDEELNRSKKSVAAGFAFDQEHIDNHVNLYTKLTLEGRENESYDSILQNFLNVTKEDIQKTAKSLFSQNPKLLVLSNNISDDEVRKYWNS